MATTQTDPPKLNHIAPGWFHDAWESLRDWLIKHRPVQGNGLLFSDAPGGGILIQSAGGPGGSISQAINFELLNASGPTGPKKIRIRQGLLHSDGSTFIPTGMFPGDSTPYITNVGSNGEAWLNVHVDVDGNTTGVTLGVGATTPASTPSTGCYTLGTYGEVGGIFTVTGAKGDINHLCNGGVHHFWT